MIKQFFEMIKKMNDGEVSLFEDNVSNHKMEVDNFSVSCLLVEQGRLCYLGYNLEYFINGKRYLLDEGYFRHNALEDSVAIDRRFPNFIKYSKKVPSKFLSYRVKSQNEYTRDLNNYEKFYTRVNNIDKDLKNFVIKIPNIKDSEAFLDDYKKKSKLVAKAFITTAKLYSEELNKQ